MRGWLGGGGGEGRRQSLGAGPDSGGGGAGGGGGKMMDVEGEVRQLIVDVKRLGAPSAAHGGKTTVKFGVLFDDEAVAQFYEALVGTLRSAKKRGVVQFEGQMLLKGAHDDVDVVLLKVRPTSPTNLPFPPSRQPPPPHPPHRTPSPP